MGAFSSTFEIANLAGERFVEITALVDTGSTYTTIPANTLVQLGVTVEGRRRFELADNSLVEYPVGQVRMRLEGQELVVLAVFAAEDADPLLGVTALEIFGLGADPDKPAFDTSPGSAKVTILRNTVFRQYDCLAIALRRMAGMTSRRNPRLVRRNLPHESLLLY